MNISCFLGQINGDSLERGWDGLHEMRANFQAEHMFSIL